MYLQRVTMVSEKTWLEIFVSSLTILVVLLFLLIGMFSIYIVKSYIKNQPVAESTPNNEFQRHTSNVAQVLLFSCFVDMFLKDVLNFKNYLFNCFSEHITRVLAVMMSLFLLSVTMLAWLEQVSPRYYLSLTQFWVDYLVGVVLLLAFVVCAYAEVGWCNSWDVCAIKNRCDELFQHAFFAIVCLLTILILLMITINKTCLKRSFTKLKIFFGFQIPIQPGNSSVNELSTISSEVHANTPAQPAPINEEEKEILVKPVTHLVTFFIVSVLTIIYTGVCYTLGHCSETSKDVFKIVVVSVTPAVWILKNKKIYKFAVRKVKVWLALEQ